MNYRRLVVALMLVITTLAIGNSRAQTRLNSAQEIAKIRERWVTDWNANKIDDIVMLYDRDSIFLPFTGERVGGHDAIRAYISQVIKSGVSNLSLRSLSVDKSDKLAVDSGIFKLTIKQPGGGTTITGGGERQVKGNYLIILKRGANGRWLIAQQAFIEAH